MPVHDEVMALAAEMTRLRHAIHREPEIGLDLPRTQEKVLAALTVRRPRSPPAGGSRR